MQAVEKNNPHARRVRSALPIVVRSIQRGEHALELLKRWAGLERSCDKSHARRAQVVAVEAARKNPTVPNRPRRACSARPVAADGAGFRKGRRAPEILKVRELFQRRRHDAGVIGPQIQKMLLAEAMRVRAARARRIGLRVNILASAACPCGARTPASRRHCSGIS